MPIAAPAMVVKPRTPAMSAITRNVRAQPSIGFSPFAPLWALPATPTPGGETAFRGRNSALGRLRRRREEAGDDRGEDARVLGGDHRGGGGGGRYSAGRDQRALLGQFDQLGGEGRGLTLRPFG